MVRNDGTYRGQSSVESGRPITGMIASCEHRPSSQKPSLSYLARAREPAPLLLRDDLQRKRCRWSRSWEAPQRHRMSVEVRPGRPPAGGL